MGRTTKWKKDTNKQVEALLKIINERASVEHGVKVSFDGLKVHDALGHLGTLVRFNLEIPPQQQFRLIQKAVGEAVINSRSNTETSSDPIARLRSELSSRLKTLEQNYLDTELKQFCLLTGLSIKYFEELEEIDVEDSSIQFFDTLPSGFSQQHIAVEEVVHPSPLPTNYTWVKVTVKARCYESAVIKALESLDFIRGLWNLMLDKHRRRFSFTRAAPLNTITLYPVHTLHHSDGEPISNYYWWESSYIKPKVSKNIKEDYVSLKEGTFERQQLIAQCEYRRKIQNMVVQYVRALDASDLQTGLMKLWSVLERITMADNHTTVVERTAFLYRHKDFHIAILNSLREGRNQFVHEGKETERAEEMLCQLRGYVAESLEFLIYHNTKFKTLDHFRDFLDLPSEQEDIFQTKQKLQEKMQLIDLYETLVQETENA